MDITAGRDFLGLCDQNSLYKHVSNFGRYGVNGRSKLGIERKDY
jgi:hypothetical protein